MPRKHSTGRLSNAAYSVSPIGTVVCRQQMPYGPQQESNLHHRSMGTSLVWLSPRRVLHYTMGAF